MGSIDGDLTRELALAGYVRFPAAHRDHAVMDHRFEFVGPGMVSIDAIIAIEPSPHNEAGCCVIFTLSGSFGGMFCACTAEVAQRTFCEAATVWRESRANQ